MQSILGRSPVSQRFRSLIWTVTKVPKQAKNGPRHPDRQLQILLCNSSPLEGLSVHDLLQAEYCLHPPSETQTTLSINSTHMHKAFCHCLEPCPGSDKEKNYPITLLQSTLQCSRHTSGACSLCKSAKAQQQLDPAALLPPAAPPKGCQGHPCAGLKGRAQPSRSSRAIIQEEVRKDPPNMLDFLAGVRSLMS